MFSSFAVGKFATRAMVQSLAREFGPKGVHVGHVIIDGIIDIEATKDYMADAGPEAKINPASVSLEFPMNDEGANSVGRLRTRTGTCTLNPDRLSRTSLKSGPGRRSGKLRLEQPVV